MTNGIHKFTTFRLAYFVLIIPLLCTLIWMMLPGLASSLSPCVPTVVTNLATNITTNSATLNGDLTSFGGCISEPVADFERSTNVFFYWGPTSGGPYPNSTPMQIKIGTGLFSAVIQSLNPCTTYYFVAAIFSGTNITLNIPNFGVRAAVVPLAVLGLERSFMTTCIAPPETKKSFVESVSPSVGNPPNTNVRSLSVQQSTYAANQPVTIHAKIMNTGDVTGGYTAVLKINGVIEQTKTGTVSGQTTQPLQFTAYRDKPGTYQVDINGQKTSFTIIGNNQQTSSINGQQTVFIGVIFIGLIVLILLALVIMRQRHT